MSTFMPKQSEVKRQWYVLDAQGKSLGRVATVAARLLRGKHKPVFTPHVDVGDYVIIINADKAVLTGNKLTQKYYRRHSGYIGNLKETRYDELMEKNPEKAMSLAVSGMIPSTPQGRNHERRLRVFKGENHNHVAQKPLVWEKY